MCISCSSVLLSALLSKETSSEECILCADGRASGIDAVCIFLAELHDLGKSRPPGLLKRCRQSFPQFRIPCALVWCQFRLFWTDVDINHGVRRRVLGLDLLRYFRFRIGEEITWHLAMKDASPLGSEIFMHRRKFTQQVYLTKCELPRLQEHNPKDLTFVRHRHVFMCVARIFTEGPNNFQQCLEERARVCKHIIQEVCIPLEHEHEFVGLSRDRNLDIVALSA